MTLYFIYSTTPDTRKAYIKIIHSIHTHTVITVLRFSLFLMINVSCCSWGPFFQLCSEWKGKTTFMYEIGLFTRLRFLVEYIILFLSFSRADWKLCGLLVLTPLNFHCQLDYSFPYLSKWLVVNSIRARNSVLLKSLSWFLGISVPGGTEIPKINLKD